MSLNKEQRRITAEELQAHFEASTLAMKAPLGIFSHQLQRFIHLVWDVRNVINDNIKENGQTPEPYTYLKGEKEDYWFLR